MLASAAGRGIVGSVCSVSFGTEESPVHGKVGSSKLSGQSSKLIRISIVRVH